MRRAMPSILMVDIDAVTLPFPKREYEEKARRILEYFGYSAVGFAYKLSNSKGLHVAVWVEPEVELMYVPLLQYLLGSDFKRECINYFRFKKGVDINVLFTAKKSGRRGGGEFRISRKCDSLCPGLIEMIKLAEKSGIYRIEV